MASSMSTTSPSSVAHANPLRLSKKTMFNLSSVPSSSTFFSTGDPRVSSASPAKVCSISLRSSGRNLTCSCSLYPLKVKAREELAESEDSSSSIAASVSASRTFLNARTENELLSGIRKEAELGSLPSNLAIGMEELYHTYKNAVFQSGDPRADETVLSTMSVIFDRVFLDIKDPFVFQPYHKAIREPFDYYKFGQNYIRPLIDFRNSYVGNITLFYEMEEKLKQGHNIILMSNHQTEADPAVIASLLETAVPYIAENLIYVAGDRVITDPLCKPFSMGRNLICVYSKKHMYDHPELVEMKKRANTRSLKEMTVLLRGGSQIFWIAPSGGRDRSDPLTGEWVPAPFDISSADNMRRLVEHAGPPGHVYPLAILCHNIMPPPQQVEKEIGERRVISFSGAGLSVSPEIGFSEITAICNNSEEAKEAYSQTLYNSVTEQYNVLKYAIHGQQGFEASIPNISLLQPWI